MTYRVHQLHEPDPSTFTAALDEEGLSWPFHDLLEHHRHPGMRFSDGTLSLVLQTVEFDVGNDVVRTIQSAMVLGPDRGVVARWTDDGLDDAFEQPFDDRVQFIQAVVEAAYDADVEALTALEERVDACELEVLDADGHGTSAQAIYHLEHELLTVRRAVGPMVGLLDKLARRAGESQQVKVAEWRDRFVRLVSQIEDIDNLLSSVLSVNLTLVSVRQNEDMRRIAAWGAIGIAPTALAGLWGMNFEHMPELSWKVGYPLALSFIASVCITLYLAFKRAGWL